MVYPLHLFLLSVLYFSHIEDSLRLNCLCLAKFQFLFQQVVYVAGPAQVQVCGVLPAVVVVIVVAAVIVVGVDAVFVKGVVVLVDVVGIVFVIVAFVPVWVVVVAVAVLVAVEM